MLRVSIERGKQAGGGVKERPYFARIRLFWGAPKDTHLFCRLSLVSIWTYLHGVGERRDGERQGVHHI